MTGSILKREEEEDYGTWRCLSC